MSLIFITSIPFVRKSHFLLIRITYSLKIIPENVINLQRCGAVIPSKSSAFSYGRFDILRLSILQVLRLLSETIVSLLTF